MKQKHLLYSFLDRNKVSVKLATEIKLFLKDRVRCKACVMEADVASLEELPRPLKEQLHFELYSGNLFPHDFFRLLNGESHPCIKTLRLICKQELLLKGDEEFYYGKDS